MAYHVIPKPGTEFGACTDPNCKHVDCIETRAQAKRKCLHCKQEIGYDALYFINKIENGKIVEMVHCKCEADF